MILLLRYSKLSPLYLVFQKPQASNFKAFCNEHVTCAAAHACCERKCQKYSRNRLPSFHDISIPILEFELANFILKGCPSLMSTKAIDLFIEVATNT